MKVLEKLREFNKVAVKGIKHVIPPATIAINLLDTLNRYQDTASRVNLFVTKYTEFNSFTGEWDFETGKQGTGMYLLGNLLKRGIAEAGY